MCNLYSHTTNQEAIRRLFAIEHDLAGNLPPMPGIESRCLVPSTSFREFNRDAGGNDWFAFDESRPLTCFAGIKVEGWTSVRKAK